jgi:hypothetical protein
MSAWVFDSLMIIRSIPRLRLHKAGRVLFFQDMSGVF